MARSKNATALFEVIHAAKKPPKSSPNVEIPSPKWWAKGKKQEKPPAVQAVQPPAEAVGRQKSWLSAARQNAAALPPVEPSTTPEPTYELPTFDAVEPVANLEPAARDSWDPTAGPAEPAVEEPPVPKKRFIDRFADRARKAPAPDVVVIPASEPVSITPDIQITHISPPDPDFVPEPEPARGKARRGDVAYVDRSAHEIKFRLSYGGMIAAVSILVMSLAIAYLAGKRFATDAADPQAAVKDADQNPGLMMGVEPVKPAPAGNSAPAPRPDVLQVPARTPHTIAPPAVPAVSTAKTTRQIGSNYVVAQSYPETDLDTATAACDYLNRAGIPCTLIKGLGEWTLRDWYSVVGTQPFTKQDPDLQEYKRRITTLGQSFTTKTYNQFQPKVYTWRADSEEK